MTVLSAQSILRLGLVSPCSPSYRDGRGNSAGLGPCSVDVTLAQSVSIPGGQFVLGSTREHFQLPPNIMARVHDKSSLIRVGLKVGNSLFDPGWRGYATLELFYHGWGTLDLDEGSAVAQVVFELLDEPTELPYKGKYQDQAPGPQEAR